MEIAPHIFISCVKHVHEPSVLKLKWNLSITELNLVFLCFTTINMCQKRKQNTGLDEVTVNIIAKFGFVELAEENHRVLDFDM